MKKHPFLLLSLSLITLILSLFWYQKAHSPVSAEAQEELTIRAPDGGEIRLTVERADTEDERSRGLMGRSRLPSGRGMIFVFEDEKDRAFWMKNTLIPLDIFYFREGGQFVSKTTMEPCQSDPCQTYPSGGPARYALEVNRGEELTQGLGVGWVLEVR